MSQEVNKLQMPFSANSIYSRDPISKMSINCRSGGCGFLIRTEKVIKADQNRETWLFYKDSICLFEHKPYSKQNECQSTS